MGEAPATALRRRLIIHKTSHAASHVDELHIQDVFRDLVADDARTALIATHVAEAVDRGRNCLVLSQWRTHLDSLQQQLTAHSLEPLVLRGGLGKRARAAVLAELNDPANRPFVLLATGSYIGEGFDCPALDALFLAFPPRLQGPHRPIRRTLVAPRRRQALRRGPRLCRCRHSRVGPHARQTTPGLQVGFELGPRPRRRRRQQP